MKIWTLGITLIILLGSIFLISAGTMGDRSGLWWTGLIMLGAGGLVPPFTRYIFGEDDGNDEE